jgi:hypothetical protein
VAITLHDIRPLVFKSLMGSGENIGDVDTMNGYEENLMGWDIFRK